MSETDNDSDSISDMNFCEGCGVDFYDSEVDAGEGEWDRCQECINAMRFEASGQDVLEEWFDKKIKRKARRENISEARATAEFMLSWKIEDWIHQELSDDDGDDGDSGDGGDVAEGAALGVEAKGTVRKRSFDVSNDQVGTDNDGASSGLKETTPPVANATQQEETAKERPKKRAKTRKKTSPKLQGDTDLVEKKKPRQRQKLPTKGSRVLRSGRKY